MSTETDAFPEMKQRKVFEDWLTEIGLLALFNVTVAVYCSFSKCYSDLILE